MEAADVLEVATTAIFTLLRVAAPVMFAALTVGLVISLVQALTQMQEITLSFVPKLIAIFVTVLLFLPFMLSTMVALGEALFEQIAGLG